MKCVSSVHQTTVKYVCEHHRRLRVRHRRGWTAGPACRGLLRQHAEGKRLTLSSGLMSSTQRVSIYIHVSHSYRLQYTYGVDQYCVYAQIHTLMQD